MKSAAMFVYCALLSSLAHAESTMVKVLKPQESSRQVRISVILDGKPIKGARVDFYSNGEAPRFSVFTNDAGLAVPPALPVGNYNAVATTEDDVEKSLAAMLIVANQAREAEKR